MIPVIIRDALWVELVGQQTFIEESMRRSFTLQLVKPHPTTARPVHTHQHSKYQILASSGDRKVNGTFFLLKEETTVSTIDNCYGTTIDPNVLFVFMLNQTVGKIKGNIIKFY